MISKATTVAEYLAELPSDRRAAIQAVRKVILENLGEGYEEGMQYGMIGYFVPHRVYPAGYHCDPKQPIPFAHLASQKNYLSVYLAGIYGDSEHATWFKAEWAKTGLKLKMGKCCIHFKSIAELPLELIGRSIARLPCSTFLSRYEALLSLSREQAKVRQIQGRKAK